MVKRSSFSREKEIFKVTLWGSLVNFLLLAFKFVSGFLGHSSAMIADAVHSLSDFITDIVVIAFVKVSGKPQDECHDYGHGKYETLATAIVGLVLCAVGIGLLVNSVETIVAFFKGDILEKPGMIALLAALISNLSKEVLFRDTIMKGKAIGSQAVIANAWHHRSDALSSIGTLAGIGGAMFLGEKWRVLDPIAAFVVSIFIMKVSIDLLKPCIDELLEKSLPKEVEDRIIEIILSHPEAKSPHHLRTRNLGNKIAIEFHVRVNPEMTIRDGHEVTKHIEKSLKDEFGDDTHIGIHIEPIK